MDAQTYMRKEFLTVSPLETLSNIIQFMEERNEHWCVVVDDTKRVVGVISSWDIVERLVPDYLEDDKHLASFTSPDTFRERFREISPHTAKSLMTADVKTLAPTDSLMKVATLMSEFHIHCLPVVDKDGKLLGVIKQSEMRKAFKDILTE